MYWLMHNIWYILLIGFILVVGGGSFLLFTGWGHRLIDWMKPTSDKFMPAKVFCEDRQIRDRRLKIGKYVVSDEKKKRSFYLVHELLMSKPKSTGKFQVVTERSARPVDFHNRISEEGWGKFPSAQRVFIDTTADIRSQSSKEATSNFMAMSLSLVAMGGAVVVVVMGIIVFILNRGGGA